MQIRQKLSDTESRGAYLDKRARVLREQLQVIEDMLSACVEDEAQ